MFPRNKSIRPIARIYQHTAMIPKPPPKKKIWSWRSQAFRGLIYQLVAIGLIVVLAWFLAHNTLNNMKIRGIQSGFDFLSGPAGFDIGESLYPFDSAQPYWQAFVVGVTNTLRVAILGHPVDDDSGHPSGRWPVFPQCPGARHVLCLC